MKAMILAGGRGSRLSEETVSRPKPMVEIGGQPILWHILRTYAAHGITDFVVCLGYKGYLIKEYFANYVLHKSDVTVDLQANSLTYHNGDVEPWRVTLADTGEDTMTGGRIRRAMTYIGDEDFCLTYGDGVANIDVSALVEFHKSSGRLATLTAVQPPGRFGSLRAEGDLVREFTEKAPGDGAWINGGFFVLSPRVTDYIDGDDTVWEQQPLERLTADGQLGCYRHRGFWHPMDTLRDKTYLEALWSKGVAPWAPSS